MIPLYIFVLCMCGLGACLFIANMIGGQGYSSEENAAVVAALGGVFAVIGIGALLWGVFAPLIRSLF